MCGIADLFGVRGRSVDTRVPLHGHMPAADLQLDLVQPDKVMST
jgi:hypothetical protein